MFGFVGFVASECGFLISSFWFGVIVSFFGFCFNLLGGGYFALLCGLEAFGSDFGFC